MLSYQHAYHAGNHADVLKHWTLMACIAYMQKKDAAFDFIDTHAGDGLYPLTSANAQKSREFESGILRLQKSPQAQWRQYLSLCQHYLQKKSYPGSPEIFAALARPQDRGWLFELHPQAHANLHRQFRNRRNCHVKSEDGFVGALALLPPISKRALVLIDPSYEIKSDYQRVVEVLEKLHKKMASASLLLWYPVVERERVKRLEYDLKNSSLRDVILLELNVAKDEDPGMSGSGMIVVNPPWTLINDAQQTLPLMAKVIGDAGKASWRCEQLLGE